MDDKPDTCATNIQNSTNHFATLPAGHICYIEVPITNEKPNYYQVNDINTLILNVAHTYHPYITERPSQTNYNLKDNRELVSSHHFSLHQVYMTNSDTIPIKSQLCKVQSTSHTLKPRVFPSLPYTTENHKFLNKFL